MSPFRCDVRKIRVYLISFERSQHLDMINYRTLCLVIGINFSAFFAQSQNATFEVTLGGFDAEAEAAFNYATDQWSQYLISDVPIKVHANLVTLLPGQLGITFPNGEKNFVGAPFNDTWCASCLANAITGTELNPGYADMDIFINSTANWYFGTDGNTPAGQYDFVSTVMHEICHGLGFLSLSNKDVTTGSFGLIYATDFFPLVTSFPWPELDTLPSAMDHYLSNGSGTMLLTFENPSDALGDEFTSNNIFCISEKVLNAHGGEAGRIYAPSTFTLGSSMSHWNEGSYPVGNENEFMTPNAASGHSSQVPGPMTLALLEEIGWEIDYTIDINTTIQPDESPIIFPNPANENAVISNLPVNASWDVVSLDGRNVASGANNVIDCKDWARGIYIVRFISDRGAEIKSSKLVLN